MSQHEKLSVLIVMQSVAGPKKHFPYQVNPARRSSLAHTWIPAPPPPAHPPNVTGVQGFSKWRLRQRRARIGFILAHGNN